MSIYKKIVSGRDFNFFNKIDINSASFSNSCDILISFPTKTLSFILEDAGIIEYSFNGTTVHGDMDSSTTSKTATFDNRSISKIWFRLASGSVGPLMIRVEAW